METVPSNNLNSEDKMLEYKQIVEDNNVLLHAECKPSRDESRAEESATLLTAQDVTSDEYDIDGMCKKLECPFTWRSDVEVKSKEQGQVFDNIIDILTRKESEFSQAEHNLFREVVVHLVLSYHKSANRQLKSGAKDLYHCFKIICSEQEMCEKSNIFCSNEPELPQQESDAPQSGSFEKECSELMDTELKNCKLDKIKSINEDNISFQKDLDSKFSERSVANTVNSQHHEETSFGNLFKINNICEWKKNENIFDSFFNDCKLNLFSNTDNDLKFGMPNQKSRRDPKPQWNGNESKDRLFALQYVVAASLVYYCRMFGFIDDALRIAKAVVNLFEEMNPVSKATVFALRGAILCEYGYAGNVLGLQWLREAQSLDPDYWEWNLYCGKVVGRVRRNESEPSSPPTEEEINFLKKTIELNPNNATALVNLANIHRTIASIRFRNLVANQSNSACVDPTVTSRLQGNWRRNSHGFYNVQREPWRSPYVYVKGDGTNNSHLNMAKELYLKALQIEPNCPYNNARCAKGLLSMPVPYKDHATAEKAILHALTLAQDNSLVNHYAGMFYEKCRDYEKALKCYEAATQNGRYNYPAELSYINLRLKISSPASYSPLFKFGILFYKYNMPNNKIQTLCSRGYYLYKIEGALIQAIRNFTAAIEISPESSLLLRFHPGSFYKSFLEILNVYDILEEVLDQCKRNSDSGAKLIIERAEEALKHRNK